MQMHNNDISGMPNRLRASRQSLGVSQSKLSKDLNFSRNYINQAEKGGMTPSLDALVRIADYLKVSIDYLLTGREFSGYDRLTVISKKLTQEQRDSLANMIDILILNQIPKD